MSKTLYILRHAKSSWSDLNISDFDRPLNKRGKLAAPLMGKFLKSKDILPDLILSSPANRALSTAKIVADAITYGSENIIVIDDIYEASLFELEGIIKNIDNDIESIMIIGHNPSLTSFLNRFGKLSLDNLPTAAIIGLRFDSTWNQIQPSSGKVILDQIPKKIRL